MKKTLFLLVFIFFLFAINTQAENFQFTSYYPAPTGNYEKVQLIPQPALPTSNCNIGTLYVNTVDNNLPYFCSPNGVGIGTFAPIAGPWTLSSNDLYLTDTTTPLNKRVGIGTTTPTFKLTIENDGGILADGQATSSSVLPVSGAGTRMMWYPKKGAFRTGYVSGSQWNDANIGTSSIAMGYDNTAASQGATVWGGQNNSASGGVAAVITGGQNNTATSAFAQILGGSGNSAGLSARVAGKNNISSGDYSMIGGGEANTSSGHYSVTSGGYANNNNGQYSTISGGGQNSIVGSYNTISGGRSNRLTASSAYSTITGGQNNTSGATYTVISAGESNIASGSYSTISGGQGNTANGPYSTIAGGKNNTTSCTTGYCSIGGGFGNVASGNYSTILGGSLNTAMGNYSLVPGGQGNLAAGDYSLAAGRFMNVSGDHTFVWGYSNIPIPSITTTDAMIIYSGSMGIRDTTPAALLEINGNGSTDDYLNLTSTDAASVGNILTIKNNGFIGVNQNAPVYPLQFGNGAYVDASGNFMPASSRIYKENIAELGFAEAMDTLAKLTPVQYNYKNEKTHRYVGFIAEDVPDLIADQGRQGLAPMDIAAVLTKVIAQQQNVLKEQKNKTEQLLKRITELKNKNRSQEKFE
jgi:hypothetical protein